MTMEPEVIFGPVDSSHPQYGKAINMVNTLRFGSDLPQFPYGDVAVIRKGELKPSEEKRYLEEKERQKPKQPQKQDKPKKARKSNYGRWEMLNNFMDTGPLEFTKTQCVVWMRLFRLADGKTNKLLTSVRDIARQTNTAESTVQIAITKLIKTGWLVRPYPSNKKGVPSQFIVKDGSRNQYR